MGPGRYVLTLPNNNGETVNLATVVTTPGGWPDYSLTILPARREDAVKNFQGFVANVVSLLELVKPDLSIWGIFDLGEYPLAVFAEGKI